MIEFQCMRCIELFSLRLRLRCLPLFESEYSHSNNRQTRPFLLLLSCWPCAIMWSPTHVGSGKPEPPLKWVCSSLAFPEPVVDFDQILSLSKFSIWLEFLLGCSLRYGATINFFPGGCPVFPKPRMEPASLHRWFVVPPFWQITLLGAFGSVSGPVVPLLSVLVPVRHGSQSFIAEASWQNVLSLRYSWFPRALLFESSPGPPRSFPHDLPHQSPCASTPH